MNTPDTRAYFSYTTPGNGDTLHIDGHHDHFHLVLSDHTNDTEGLEPGFANICFNLKTVIEIHKVLGEHIACAALTMQELQTES